MYHRILVPYDGSETSQQALDAALGLARESGGQLRLVHVVEEVAYLTGYDQFGGYSGALLKAMRDNGEKLLAEGVARARAAGVEAETVLFDQFGERLGESVAKSAKIWNADLVVVGTHGRRGIGRALLGSGAEDVIRQATVPVLVIRTPAADGAA